MDHVMERPIRYAMSNSFGFGGTNASLLFKKFDPNTVESP